MRRSRHRPTVGNLRAHWPSPTQGRHGTDPVHRCAGAWPHVLIGVSQSSAGTGSTGTRCGWPSRLTHAGPTAMSARRSTADAVVPCCYDDR